MVRKLLLIAFLVFVNTKNANAALSKGAALLFSKGEGYENFTGRDLSDVEKEEVFKLMKLTYSVKTKSLFGISDSNFEFPFHATVRIVDLNRDGRLDVFVHLFSIAYFGQGGQEHIFTKTGSGRFSQIAEISGFCEILTTGANSFPDLLVGGPGMTAPVMRFSRGAYRFFKTASFAEGNSPKTYSFKEYSALQRK